MHRIPRRGFLLFASTDNELPDWQSLPMPVRTYFDAAWVIHVVVPHNRVRQFTEESAPLYRQAGLIDLSTRTCLSVSSTMARAS